MEDEFLLFVIASFQKRKFRSHVFFFFLFFHQDIQGRFFLSVVVCYILEFSLEKEKGGREIFEILIYIILPSFFFLSFTEERCFFVLEFEDTFLLCGGENKDKFKIISLIYY